MVLHKSSEVDMLKTKTDRHDINKILLKVAQKAINQLSQPTTQLLWKDKVNTEIYTSVELLA
jgi:hypothetical protein